MMSSTDTMELNVLVWVSQDPDAPHPVCAATDPSLHVARCHRGQEEWPGAAKPRRAFPLSTS